MRRICYGDVAVIVAAATIVVGFIAACVAERQCQGRPHSTALIGRAPLPIPATVSCETSLPETCASEPATTVTRDDGCQPIPMPSESPARTAASALDDKIAGKQVPTLAPPRSETPAPVATSDESASPLVGRHMLDRARKRHVIEIQVEAEQAKPR